MFSLPIVCMFSPYSHSPIESPRLCVQDIVLAVNFIHHHGVTFLTLHY